MLLTLFNGTCGLGISPGRWFCISERSVLGNSPFSSDDYYIFTFGYLVTAAMVMPLGFFSLVENIYVQIISFIVLSGVLIQWVVAFGQEGLVTERLPVAGPDSSLVLGIVIFNYSYITTVIILLRPYFTTIIINIVIMAENNDTMLFRTLLKRFIIIFIHTNFSVLAFSQKKIPTLVNDLKPTVSIHKTLTISVIISTIMYILLGKSHLYYYFFKYTYNCGFFR